MPPYRTYYLPVRVPGGPTTPNLNQGRSLKFEANENYFNNTLIALIP